MRMALALLAAVVVGFPAGWILAMLLTPLLWKLEPVLHMEWPVIPVRVTEFSM